MNKGVLEIIAEKSRYLIDAQIQSYRSLFTKAGTIIGVGALFIPIFLFILHDSILTIKIVSIAPIILMVIGLILMLLMMRSPQFFRGFKEDKFEDLINLEYEELLTDEISANITSINENGYILYKAGKKFNWGIICFIISIIISVILLIISGFIN